MHLLRTLPRVLGVAAVSVVLGAGGARVSFAARPLDRIGHIVVIYQENWSFDSLYGHFPGANGLATAGATIPQVDKNGQPYATLPPSIDTNKTPRGPDPRVPADLPVAPFNLAQFISPAEVAGNPIHEFYREQYQIDGGKMDKFVAWTDVGGLVMSYYDATRMPEGRLAEQYVLADNFFHAAFGGSYLNHFWLICACTPVWPDAPPELRAQLDGNGILVKNGLVTPDGYSVNTSYTVNTPHPARITDAKRLVPNQTMPTIGDRLSERGISWTWYAGGWKDALAGHPHPLFQYHHHPFAYFARYADGTGEKSRHLRDEQEFLRDLEQARLPEVAFVKPLGPDNEHPGYAALLRGQEHVYRLVRAVMNSLAWPTTTIIITYDENGGRWDHIPPPKVDRWGPGTRVPTIVVAPFAKRHYVDHTLYDTTSILKLIETRWNLRPLGTRDAAANDLTDAFNF